jgi:hypothetical protein
MQRFVLSETVGAGMGMLLGRREAITTEAPLHVRAVALQSQYRLRTDETTLTSLVATILCHSHFA